MVHGPRRRIVARLLSTARRRATAASLAGAVLVLGLFAPPAQGGDEAKRVGLLGTLDTRTYQPLVDALAHGLGEAGSVKNRRVTFEPRYAGGRPERLPVLARELVSTAPDVIVVWGDQAIQAATAATTTVPLVMIACDADAAGLVDNLARPSGNLTGVNCMSAELGTKRLGILREIRPGLSRVGILWNPDDPSKALELRETERAARALGVDLQPEEVRDLAAVENAFRRLETVDALIVLGEPLTFQHRAPIAALAARHRLPAMYAFRECVEAGGLLSYGPDKGAMFELAGRYAARILEGATPAELPIQQPTRFELAISVRAAEALGLTIPRPLLLQADHVLE